MQNPIISVVVVNYNGEPYLKDCLSSLLDQSFKSFEVIVVDNGSKDGSLELIRKDFSGVKLISLDRNTGFARGNNLGIEASSSRYIATLNNDAVAEPGWLEALFEAAEANSSIGMVASKIFLGREGKKLDSVGMLVYPDGMSRQRGRGEVDKGQFHAIKEVLFPSACAALYRREMLCSIGPFDADFFSYCEDSDLGLRGRLAGWGAVLAPKAVVRHLYSQTGGKYSRLKAYLVERNHLWVLIKDLPLRYVLVSPVYLSWRYLIQFYGLISGKGSVARFAGKEKKSKVFTVAVRAHRDASIRLLSMLSKRRTIWKSRRISVQEYISLLKRHQITAEELMLKD